MTGVMSLFLMMVLARAASADQFTVFDSKHYVVHIDVSHEQALPFADHMDLIFENYKERFKSFHSHHTGKLNLYLLKNSNDYVSFLGKHHINGRNSGGMFFRSRSLTGLATFIDGQAQTEAFATLQHEGFHQFAWNYIGHNLPTWVNEGIAQFFQDGIVVHGKLRLGYVNAVRLAIVKTAVQQHKFFPVKKLFTISGKQWGHILTTDPQDSARLYAEAWDLVFYMVVSDEGRYRKNLVKYLHLVADGTPSEAAHKKAFPNISMDQLNSDWIYFVHQQMPDPLSMAVAHLEFLGSAMAYLHKHHQPIPNSVAGLRAKLRSMGFTETYYSDGVPHTISALNDHVYVFPVGGGYNRFVMGPPAKRGLLPQLTAPGLSPRPILGWVMNPDGNLAQTIAYR